MIRRVRVLAGAKIQKVAATTVAFLALSQCTSARLDAQRSSKQKHADCPVIVPNAMSPKYVLLSEGREQLTYAVKANYPARNVLAYISSNVSKVGFKPLKYDFLNPGLPSSHVRGWVEFEDRADGPSRMVQQWLADWQNGSGDIAVYSLEYTYPPAPAIPELELLHVVALFIPAGTATAMKTSAVSKP